MDIDGAFDLIDPAAWNGVEPPEREWMLDGFLPRRRAAYLTGSGGAGKSLLGQQLATCIALGLPFLGVETTQAPAIYLTAEDDHDELQRRQRAICNSLGVTESDLQLKLFFISLFGKHDNEMIAFDRESGLCELPAWQRLRHATRITLTRFVVLDNVSHVFGGSEIDRHQVTGFANYLNGLALDINGSVLLVGHPNKQGDAYSGSTAWENAFRARLYFDAPKVDHAHTDPDLRQLSLPKANYARKGAAIDVRWFDGALIRDDDLPPSVAAEVRKVSTHTAANEAFLRCLDAATKQRRAVSHVPGVNYGPKLFAGMTEGRSFAVEDFAGAMERLLHLGHIEVDQPLWQGGNRHWKYGISRCANPCANPAPTPGADCAKSLKSLAPTPCADPCADPAPTLFGDTAKSLKDMRQPLRQPAPTPFPSPPPLRGEREEDWEASSPPPLLDDELDWSTDDDDE